MKGKPSGCKKETDNKRACKNRREQEGCPPKEKTAGTEVDCPQDGIKRATQETALGSEVAAVINSCPVAGRLSANDYREDFVEEQHCRVGSS